MLRLLFLSAALLVLASLPPIEQLAAADCSGSEPRSPLCLPGVHAAPLPPAGDDEVKVAEPAGDADDNELLEAIGEGLWTPLAAVFEEQPALLADMAAPFAGLYNKLLPKLAAASSAGQFAALHKRLVAYYDFITETFGGTVPTPQNYAAWVRKHCHLPAQGEPDAAHQQAECVRAIVNYMRPEELATIANLTLHALAELLPYVIEVLTPQAPSAPADAEVLPRGCCGCGKKLHMPASMSMHVKDNEAASSWYTEDDTADAVLADAPGRMASPDYTPTMADKQARDDHKPFDSRFDILQADGTPDIDAMRMYEDTAARYKEAFERMAALGYRITMPDGPPPAGHEAMYEPTPAGHHAAQVYKSRLDEEPRGELYPQQTAEEAKLALRAERAAKRAAVAAVAKAKAARERQAQIEECQQTGHCYF
jgi:hypothetical protein